MFSFVTNFLEPVGLAIYLLAVFVRFHRSRDKSIKLLLFYYALATAIMVYSSLDILLRNESSTIWTYDLLAMLTSVLIGAYFHQVLRSKVKRYTVVALVALYVIYALVRSFALPNTGFFDSIGYSLVSASIVVYVFMYFHQVLKHVTEANILRDFDFWLASSYLLYFVGSFLIFLTYHYLTKKILNTYTHEERGLLTALWGLHNVLLFVGALSVLLGSLWVNYRKRLA